MPLNTQGIISAVTIVLYVPAILFAVRLLVKYGMRERAWFLLVLFASIRIVGGVLLVAAELILPPVIGLYIGGYALEASGLSPLLLSTLGILEIITEGPTGEKQHGRPFRFLHMIGMAALILTIIGISTSNGASNTERRAGVLVFAGLYIVLVFIAVMLWMRRGTLLKYRAQLLIAVSAALPFLAIRTLYSVLSTFSSSHFINTTGAPTAPNTSPLAKFNMFTGSWQIYLVMEVLMEYAVMIIYTVAGTMLPLDQDYGKQQTDEYPLYTGMHY